MPEHSHFDLQQIDGRSMVRLRVRPSGAGAAGDALQLPQQALHWSGEDPAACWLGPDQWLLTSDYQPAEDIIGRIDTVLSGQVYAATDMSSHYLCLSLKGPAARIILAMGSGFDMHRSAFKVGQCIRTHFANVLLFIVVVKDNDFDLYVDRSHARYLNNWLVSAGEDPITRSSDNHKMTVT